jgi:hypothetical protein
MSFYDDDDVLGDLLEDAGCSNCEHATEAHHDVGCALCDAVGQTCPGWEPW